MLLEKLKNRLRYVEQVAAGAVASMLQMEALSYDEDTGVYVLRAKTEEWMRNTNGTLHGGMCATIADQAMGVVAYCHRPGDGMAPTITMQTEYHRPLIPGEDVICRVRMQSVTRTLLRAAVELYRESIPDKLCVSASATFFYVDPDRRR